MKGSVSIDETAHINKELAEVPADASLATIILTRVGEQCATAPLKDSPQPHCIKGPLKHHAESLHSEPAVQHARKQSPLHWQLFFLRPANLSQLLSENWTLANQHHPQRWLHQTFFRG